MVLDIVEVAASHTGANLAQAFIAVLKDFKISDKVSEDILKMKCMYFILIPIDSVSDLRQRFK